MKMIETGALQALCSRELPEPSFCLHCPWSVIQDDTPAQFLLPLACALSSFIPAVCGEAGTSPRAWVPCPCQPRGAEPVSLVLRGTVGTRGLAAQPERSSTSALNASAVVRI